jgi:hypothetical protein
MANLIALLEKIGPNAVVLIAFLIANKDQIDALITLLMTLFNVPPPAKTAVSEAEFIAACKKAGASTGDAQELLAALPA